MKFTPYLNFPGTCREAFEFYQKATGGTIESMISHGETPAGEFVADDWKHTIMHARLAVGDAVIMGSDAPREMEVTPQGIYVSIHADTPEEADRIYAALSEGGQVQMEIQKTFWAERFAMFVDRFGIPWMINCEMVTEGAASA